MEQIVNGKRVVFVDRLGARANWDLMQKFGGAGLDFASADFDTIVGFIGRFVTEWEFDGDPKDPHSYDDMDLFEEMLPMFTAATGRLSSKAVTGTPDAEESPKN